MSSFDDIFDSVIITAKKAVTVAGKKTSDAVEIGKIKYQEQVVAKDITKAYAKLGALVYESRTKNEELEEVIAQTIQNISDLNLKLDGLTGAFAAAIEEIKKPVDTSEYSSVSTDIEIDLDEELSDLDDLYESTEDIAENVSDLADKTAAKITDEVDDLVDDLKSTLE